MIFLLSPIGVVGKSLDFLELGGISSLCSSLFSSIYVCLLPLYLRKEYFNELYLPMQ